MSLPSDVAARPGTPVTPAERRALDAVTSHGSVKGAAAFLGRSPRTVENQLAAARSRLGVTTTLQAAVRVLTPDVGENPR